MKVAIVGSTGYSAIELIRIIDRHPHFQLGTLISSSQSNKQLAQVFPHLSHITHTFETWSRIESLEEELVFLATPPGMSRDWSPQLLNQGKKVIDLSGDFRLSSSSYETWYKRKPAAEKWLQKAVYGLTEWFSDEIAQADLIANPGCYPTATLLALLPLYSRNIIPLQPVIVDAKSGVTGAGRSPTTATLYGEVNENLRPYKLGEHQHIPEIEQVLGDETKVSFVPHIVPMSRGLLVTIHATGLNNYSEDQLWRAYQQVYQNQPFIRLLSQTWPETRSVRGSNFCDIAFHFDSCSGQLTIMAAIDNLVKGAAGQAVQNANCMMGWDQSLGLNFSPLVP